MGNIDFNSLKKIPKIDTKLSPLMALTLAAFVMFVVTFFVIESIDETVRDILFSQVKGASKTPSSMSQLINRRSIPLYGDNRLKRKLVDSINENIFVVEPIKTNIKSESNVEEKVVPNKNTVKKLNWNKPTLSTLKLKGLSTTSSSAYINLKRYNIGNKITEYPIILGSSRQIATLVKVKRDKAVVSVAGQWINLRLPTNPIKKANN